MFLLEIINFIPWTCIASLPNLLTINFFSIEMEIFLFRFDPCRGKGQVRNCMTNFFIFSYPVRFIGCTHCAVRLCTQSKSRYRFRLSARSHDAADDHSPYYLECYKFWAFVILSVATSSLCWSFWEFYSKYLCSDLHKWIWNFKQHINYFEIEYCGRNIFHLRNSSPNERFNRMLQFYYKLLSLFEHLMAFYCL